MGLQWVGQCQNMLHELKMDEYACEGWSMWVRGWRLHVNVLVHDVVNILRGFCNSAEPRYPRTLIELCLTLIQRDDCTYIKQTGIALEGQKVGFYSVI